VVSVRPWFVIEVWTIRAQRRPRSRRAGCRRPRPDFGHNDSKASRTRQSRTSPQRCIEGARRAREGCCLRRFAGPTSQHTGCVACRRQCLQESTPYGCRVRIRYADGHAEEGRRSERGSDPRRLDSAPAWARSEQDQTRPSPRRCGKARCRIVLDMNL